MRVTKTICCIYGEEIIGHTFNASPVWDGECCENCNWKVVIPERIRMSNLNNQKQNGTEH